MKKTLIALAAVAVSGAAFAQVTLTGAFSVSVGKNAGDANATMSQTDGALTFGATEDLGGGLTFTGSQTFSMTGRNSIGAENFSAALATANAGTLSYSNVAAASALLGSPASLGYAFNDALGGDVYLSMFKYALPTIVDGLSLSWASYSVGASTSGNALNVENFLTDKQANAYTAAYATGPVSAAIEWRQNGNHRTRLQVGYDAGIAKLTYRTELKVDSGAKQSNFTLTAPMGAASFGLFYGEKGAVKGTEASVGYALSKRTAASVNVGNVSGATTNGASYRVKLAHSF